MFRRLFKRVRKIFRRNNKVNPLDCNETESGSHDEIGATQEFCQKQEFTPEKDKIEIPIETPVLAMTWSDEEEEENPTASSMDIRKGSSVTCILVKEAVECLDTLTHPECPEDTSPIGILEDENAFAETTDTTKTSERFSLLSLNWSDFNPLDCNEAESGSHDEIGATQEFCQKQEFTPEKDKIEIPIETPVLAMTWSDEEEEENPTASSMDIRKGSSVTCILVKEAVECLDTLTHPECPEDTSPIGILEDENAFAETTDTTKTSERFSLLSHLNWSDEQEIADVDKEADSLLRLSSWPSEEEIGDEEAGSLLNPMSWSSEEDIGDIDEDTTSDSSDGITSDDSSFIDPSLPSDTKLQRVDERNKTFSDSYCMERAFQATANIRNPIQEPTCSGYQTSMVRCRRPTISQSSVEDFSFLTVLGEGGFGKVFLAEHKHTRKRVALKAIPKNPSDPSAAEDIETEKRIMKLVKKEKAPFLVGLITSFETNYNECLIMEFASGGDLFSLIVKYDLPLECSRFYSACLVLGLKFLHEHRIVHRDLKTTNILLDKRGYPQISDYGLSITDVGFGQYMNEVCGNTPYKAPELFTDLYYTRSVDWWALGVIMYEMILGKRPFDGEDSHETTLNIIYERPEYPLTLPAHVRDILQGLLTKTSALRLGSSIEGAQAVMERPFFYGMDWEALRRKEIKPMFIIP